MMRVQGKLLGGAVTHDISSRGVRLQVGTSEYDRLSEPPAIGSACSVVIYPPRRWEPIQLEGSIRRVAPLAPDEHGPIDDIFIELAREFPGAHMFRSAIAVVGQPHQKLESIRAIIEEECEVRSYARAEDLLDDLRRRSSPNLVIGPDAGLLRALAPHRHLLDAEILLTEDDTAGEVPAGVYTLARDFTTIDLIRAIDRALLCAQIGLQLRNKYTGMSSYYDEAMLAGYYDYKTTAANLLALAPEATRILEVGVGTAIVAAELKQLLPAAEFVGIDHTEAMVEKARVRLDGWGQLRCDDIAQADLGQTFDLIFSHGGVWVFLTDYLLTHIYDRRRNQLALKTVSRHLRRDGKLLINIQPMHTAADTTLHNGARFTQHVTYIDGADGFLCHKDYVLESDNRVQGFQRCSYRLTPWRDALALLASVGLEHVEADDQKGYRVFRKR